MSSPKVLVLAIAAVEENPNALRNSVEKDAAAYLELKDQIKDVGLLNPISVREYEKEDKSIGYRLVDGLHRLTAMQELGHTEIPANVVTFEDSKLLIAQIAGNNSIKTTRSQFAGALKRLIQHNGSTVKDVSRLVHKSEKWVNEQLGLLDLPEGTRKLVDEGKVNAANAQALRRVKTADDYENWLQRALTESAETFSGAVDEYVKEAAKAAKEGRKPVTEFVPKARVRKTTELTTLVTEATATGNAPALRVLIETQGIADPFAAALATLKWVLSLDPTSLAAEKAKWDAEKAEKEANAAKRKAETEAKKKAAAEADVAAAVAA